MEKNIAISIEQASKEDMPRILEIYDIARSFMLRCGNSKQWGNNYPPQALLYNDISRGQLYVVKDKRENIYAVFSFIIGDDPTYANIDGNWLLDTEYGTIHRVASDGNQRGVFGSILSFCATKIEHLRIDTHTDNKIMQYLIEKNGFVKCGIIYTCDGTPRIAYEKI